jgi:hypothetical protein
LTINTVINKVLSTIYTGVAVEKFFTTDKLCTIQPRKESTTHIITTSCVPTTQLAPLDRQLYDPAAGDENAIDEQGYPRRLSGLS